MPQLASALDVKTRHVTRDIDERIPPDTDYWLTDYFGESGAMKPGPQSFLAETNDKNAVITPHFHKVDQFQVFWTVGKFGKRAVDPIYVHYTDAYTIYGPIWGAEGKGLRWLTVRSKSDPGPRYMPGSRLEREGRKAGRHLEVSVGIPETDRDAPAVETVIGPYEDGLGVHVVQLGPGDPLPVFTPAAAGVHYLLLDGTLVYEGREHPPLSTFYVDEDGLTGAEAGADGLASLVLQFPVRDPDA
jgi:hypothetical protein